MEESLEMMVMVVITKFRSRFRFRSRSRFSVIEFIKFNKHSIMPLKITKCVDIYLWYLGFSCFTLFVA